MTQTPDGLDDLYQDIILDHYRNPRHKGNLPVADLQGEGFNPFCGDQVSLTLAIDTEGRISAVGFEGQGCSISQASASMLTDHMEGKTLSEVEALVSLFKNIMRGDDIAEGQEEALGDIISLQGVKQFPVRIKCALLGWTTLQDAITQYRQMLT